jgi:hypothetical protein
LIHGRDYQRSWGLLREIGNLITARSCSSVQISMRRGMFRGSSIYPLESGYGSKKEKSTGKLTKPKENIIVSHEEAKDNLRTRTKKCLESMDKKLMEEVVEKELENFGSKETQRDSGEKQKRDITTI